MNVSHLFDSDLLGRLEDMWATEESEAADTGRDTTSILFKGLYKSKRITRTWGKHRRDHRRQEEAELRKRFEVA